MEDIARDPEIGPELFTLLSQKLKTTKHALTASLKKNEVLREEITELQAQVERSRTWPKDSEEVAEDQVIAACQRGQRKIVQSKDEVQLLRTQLAAANKKLKDVEQALQEQADKSERFKQKCERAKLRSKEKQATIDNLHEQLHQLRQRTEQLKDGHCGSLDDDGSPNSDDKGEIIVVSPNQPPIPLKWLQEPCMAPSVQPKHLSLCSATRGLMRNGSALFCPARCSVDYVGGSAIFYACDTRYDTAKEPMELRWVPSNNLAGMIGQKKEMFYLEDGTVRYAGTFEASRDVCEYRTEEYRNIAEELRRRLLKHCPLPTRQLTKEEKIAIEDRFWLGKAKLQYLRWQRIGFNKPLFMAMLDLRAEHLREPSEGTHDSEDQRKRTIDHTRPGNTKRVKVNRILAPTLTVLG